MDILDDMGVSKLSAKVFFLKVNYSFKLAIRIILYIIMLLFAVGYSLWCCSPYLIGSPCHSVSTVRLILCYLSPCSLF